MRILLVLSVVTAVSAFYGSGDDVIELNPSNFNSKVVQSDDLWLVEFYAPWCGHCQSLTPDWKKAASALKGIVKVGAVDANEHQSLGGQYGVKGFPTIKIFGGNKNSPQDYQGGRNAQAIVNEAMSLVRSMVTDRLSGKKSGSGGSKSGGGSKNGGGSKQGDPADVIELTDSNFNEKVLKSEDMWLVEFYAPWCGHCKNLAPEWAKAASELKGKVKVAALDATEHSITANKYGVQGYPSIKFFPAGKKDSAEEYDGGRTASDIVQWALDKHAENIPAPEIHQLTSQSILNGACDDHQLCVISILPHILDCDSKCRNNYIKVLTGMGEKYKKRMWGWVWAEGGAQPEVEESLGIGGFGYPAMAAVNSRKAKFAILKGAFSETGINEFLRQLALGRGSTAPLKSTKLPSVQDSEPWDGKDGELPEEEDIDLSDVELDDLDDDSKDEL